MWEIIKTMANIPALVRDEDPLKARGNSTIQQCLVAQGKKYLEKRYLPIVCNAFLQRCYSPVQWTPGGLKSYSRGSADKTKSSNLNYKIPFRIRNIASLTNIWNLVIGILKFSVFQFHVGMMCQVVTGS